MARTVHQQLLRAAALQAWEPRDGHAILTCKVRVQHGAYDTWENRTYEFVRTDNGWTIGTNPGYLRAQSWDDCVDWLCRMQPTNIDLLTTV